MSGLITSRFAGMGRGMRASGGDILQNPDFYTDPHAIALYRYEKNHLTRDSTGHGNTLSSLPDETTTRKEGRGAANFVKASLQYQTIADAALSAGYPGKSGDATKKITICWWMYPIALVGGTYYMVYQKGNYAASPNGKISWFCRVIQTAIRWGVSVDGSTYLETALVCGTVVNQWFHCAIAYDGVTKDLYMRVWDDTGAHVHDSTSVTAQAPYISDGPVYHGVGNLAGALGVYLDGIIDEFVVFNSILTSAQIDKVRNGTYDL